MKKLMIIDNASIANAYMDALEMKTSAETSEYIEGRSELDDNDYVITWTMGNMVVLSYPEKYDKKYKSWNIDDLPFFPDHFKFEIIRKNWEQYQSIKRLYSDKNISEIIYAIGKERLYELRIIEMLMNRKTSAPHMVLWSDSLTSEGIREGLDNMRPLSEYENLVQAQQMRIIQNYTFSINFSRLLTIKYGYQFHKEIKAEEHKSISISRESIYVLSLLAARKNEIENYRSRTLYKVKASFQNSGNNYDVVWNINEKSQYYNSPVLYNNQGFIFKKDADTFLDEIKKEPNLTIASIESENKKTEAPLPYDLAHLQEDCSIELGLLPAETLMIAQKLYALGLITYPLTQSRHMDIRCEQDIEGILEGLKQQNHNIKYTNQILQFGMYSVFEKCLESKGIPQHHAIIPTGKCRMDELSSEEVCVYNLIVDNFLGQFLPAAEYQITRITLSSMNGETFSYDERKLVKSGYLELYENKKPMHIINVPMNLKENDTVTVEYALTEHNCRPMPYTMGDLIEEINRTANEEPEYVIGNPETRTKVFEKLIKHDYIHYNNETGEVSLTCAGEAIYNIVIKTIPQYTDFSQNVNWDKGICQIEKGIITKKDYESTWKEEIGHTVKRIRDTLCYIEKDTFLKCPFCHNNIFEISKGYKCSSPKEKCGFFVAKSIGSVQIDRTILTDLVELGHTKSLTFDKKSGKGTYEANLAINRDSKKIDFKFTTTY